MCYGAMYRPSDYPLGISPNSILINCKIRFVGPFFIFAIFINEKKFPENYQLRCFSFFHLVNALKKPERTVCNGRKRMKSFLEKKRIDGD